jgi:thiamine kinase-like enzyme
MDVDLKSIFERVPTWAGAQDIQYERITGLTNTNYCITVDGERFVLRVSGGNTRWLGINREYEVKALQAAAAAGIGPDLVAFLPPEGHMVTRWINGRHWNAAEFRTPEHVRLLTGTVQRVHSLPKSGAIFSPFRRVEAYIEIASGNEVPFPADFDGLLETMRSVEIEQQGDRSDWQHFCHNDLVSVNYLFCDKEESIRILDWEFAGLGDIYYDLATVVYTHDNVGPIPPELEEVMLAGYFGKVTDQQHRRLQGMKFMLMLFTGMWGLAQHGMQKGGLIPAVEGFDYLEFAQYLFEHDIRELQSAL